MFAVVAVAGHITPTNRRGSLQHWQDMAEGLPADDALWLIELARAQILLNASAFFRRVCEPLQRFPHRILLMGKNPDRAQCSIRQVVARELLETRPEDLEVNARKIRTQFMSELQVAAQDGLLVGRLRVLVRSVSRVWKADTRECERINKQLKLFTERGPTSSPELISSRAGIKHCLGEAQTSGATRFRHKWSHFRPQARRIMDVCMESWRDKQDVQENVARWCQPASSAASAFLPSAAKLTAIFAQLHPDQRPTIARSWAACYNMMLNKHLSAAKQSGNGPNPVNPVIAIACRTSRGSAAARAQITYYAVAEKIRKTHSLARCTWQQKPGPQGRQNIMVQQPLCFSTSLEVLASYWEAVQNGCHVQVFVVPTCQPSADAPHLGCIGHASSGSPKSILVLKKPSQKTRQKLEGQVQHRPHHESEQPSAPPTACTSSKQKSEAENSVRAKNDDDNSDAEISEGLNLLLEEAEAEANDDAVTPLHGEDNAYSDEGLMAEALSAICLEGSVHAADELEMDAPKIASQQEAEVSQQAAVHAERLRAQEAISNGLSPPDLSVESVAFMREQGMHLDDDNIPEEIALEVVLNQQGTDIRDTMLWGRAWAWA